MIAWLLGAAFVLVLVYEFGPAALAIALVLSPPRFDPAIRLKEWLHARDPDRPDDRRRTRHPG